jgi:hypothetical protein
MSIRNILRSAAGLFVELPPETAESAAPTGGEPMSPEKIADLLRDVPEPQIAPGAATTELPADPPAIYRLAGVPPATCPIEEVAALIEKHRDLDREMARKAVAVALEFRPGVTVRDILTDGAAKLQALQTYEEAAAAELSRLQAQTTEQAEAVSARLAQTIADLERQIADTRHQAHEEIAAAEAALEARRESQSRLEEALRVEAIRIHETLDFLTPDVPPGEAAPTSRAGEPSTPGAAP